VAALVGGFGRWLIPGVFIVIGGWVLVRSGALANLTGSR
jgi:cadmium resistance protein CadD (predicted permease)